MNKTNYKEMLEKILDFLQIENVINNIQWSVSQESEIITFEIKDKKYIFKRDNCENIKIFIKD